MFIVQTSVIDVELIQYGGVPVVIGAITSHVLYVGGAARSVEEIHNSSSMTSP